jgi:DNA-binding IclR family transcriptional regulator
MRQSDVTHESRVQVIDRLAEILRCFTPTTPLLTYSQIVARTGLSKATAHRLLTAMEDNGLIRRVQKGGAYALGYQMLRWASIAQQSNDLPAQARPLLEDLVARTGETAVLMIRDGERALCLDRLDSPQPLRLSIAIGDRVMLHAGSSAKIFLAYLDAAELERIVAQVGLPRFSEHTITDLDVLRSELAHIRVQGYASSFEERDAGAAGVTAPVFDSLGDLVAALGIVGPITRVRPETITALAEAVTGCAARLSRALGFQA